MGEGDVGTIESMKPGRPPVDTKLGRPKQEISVSPPVSPVTTTTPLTEGFSRSNTCSEGLAFKNVKDLLPEADKVS